MVKLGRLVEVRDHYAAALSKHGDVVHCVEERLSDKMLEITGHVFVVKNINRIIQISIEEDALACAFIKRLGENDEDSLLQIFVNPNDLKTQECVDLFKRWIVTCDSEESLQKLLSEFSGAS